MEVHPLVFVNTNIVNAYILHCKTSTRQTKEKYDCWISSRRRKAETPLYMGPVTAANDNNYELSNGIKEGKEI